MENVKAEVIDNDLEKLSEADKWLASIQERVDAIVDDYSPHEITSHADYKESKLARTQARKEIKAITDEAASKLKAFKDFISAVEAGKRKALLPLTTIDIDYKRYIDQYEALITESKLQDVEAAYMDYAPALVELIPFSKLQAKYAREEKWENLTTNSETIKQALYKHVDQIAEDEQTIEAQPVDEAERQAMKADYFQSLDLGEVLRKSSERLRVAKLEAERKARLEEEKRALVEKPQPQVEEPLPELQPQVEAKPIDMPKVTHNPQPEVEERSSYVVIIPSATEAMVDEIIDAFRVCDLMAIAQKGTLEDVYRRLNGNR
ncbi:MAG: hypothetical protein KHZ79_01145 [Atopobium minutum]|uniref:DUF1351 domain-containing protein n=1 Tax=Atopobium minutum TaxID=1381 RepID=A0AB38A4X6_9ACTN|nr:hypothetical protein [Atopobium minutum]KRN55067.1 hypothetical protein IV72_GL000566 [Atopobium minutum]MBS4872977.1 hypothetical protein [Atopobium minutum]SEB44327.1 hypothetical protein SAMN04489746_0239 [Atopobium minutum]